MAKFIMLITRPWPFVLQTGASLLQSETVNLVKHMETQLVFFTSLHKVRGMMWLQLPLNWGERWSTALTPLGILDTTKTSAGD